MSDGPDHLHPLDSCDNGIHVVGSKQGKITGLAHMRVVKEGQPFLPGETVYTVNTDTGEVVDKTQVPGGPSRASTPQYREGWDRIFGNGSDGGDS